MESSIFHGGLKDWTWLLFSYCSPYAMKNITVYTMKTHQLDVSFVQVVKSIVALYIYEQIQFFLSDETSIMLKLSQTKM